MTAHIVRAVCRSVLFAGLCSALTACDLAPRETAQLRLTLDGRAAPGNPMYEKGGATAEIWSYGHRSPLGLASRLRRARAA